MLIKGFLKLFYQTLSSYSRPAESGLVLGRGGRDPTVDATSLLLGMEEMEARGSPSLRSQLGQQDPKPAASDSRAHPAAWFGLINLHVLSFLQRLHTWPAALL